MKKRVYSILPLLLSLLVLFSGCSLQQETFHDTNTDSMVSLEEIPAFQEVPYLILRLTEINRFFQMKRKLQNHLRATVI